MSARDIERDDLTARLLRHRTAELEEYKRAALSRDMSPEFVAEFEALKQQLAGAVVLTDAGIVRAERWMLNEMHDGLTNRECIDAILSALRGQ